jgi:hypothetical protein
VDFQTAQTIISAYGKTIEQRTATLHACPDSELPYPRSEVKEAIQFMIQVLGQEHRQLREALVVAYGTLALFIPAHEAEILAKVRTAAPGSEVPDRLRREAERIEAGIAREQEDLLKEALSLGSAA